MPSDRRRIGFTLVEVLAVIGIVAVIVAIALPAIGSARKRASAVASAANLQQLGLILQAYVQSHQDRYPFAAGGQLLPMGGCGSISSSDPFFLSIAWPGVLTEYRDASNPPRSFLSPGARRLTGCPWWPTSYQMSASFLASWEAWTVGPPAPELARAVNTSEVQAPAQKALLYDGEAPYLGPVPEDGSRADFSVPVLTADGSVRERRPRDATPPVANRVNPAGTPRPLHDTPLGVRGFDYP